MLAVAHCAKCRPGPRLPHAPREGPELAGRLCRGRAERQAPRCAGEIDVLHFTSPLQVLHNLHHSRFLRLSPALYELTSARVRQRESLAKRIFQAAFATHLSRPQFIPACDKMERFRSATLAVLRPFVNAALQVKLCRRCAGRCWGRGGAAAPGLCTQRQGSFGALCRARKAMTSLNACSSVWSFGEIYGEI